MKSFINQVAIITGGANGLGRALASELVRQGATVALFDVNARLLAEAQRELGETAICMNVDVTNEAAIRAAVHAVAANSGKIDVLVNCAGIVGKVNVLSHEMERADFESVLRVNLLGAFSVTSAAIPFMIKRRYGRILHVASMAGKDGNAGMAAYSVSKAALIGLTKVQGKEYAEMGITVNAIAPALLHTDIYTAMPRALAQPLEDKIPMRRVGTKEEFATMAAFIVSPGTSFTTGFTFDLSGGRATY